MGGPNSINLNNHVNGSGYNPRQGGAPKAPNLKELVLTIDDFRQFASGKYNAGAVPGERMGASHAWERLESEDIDPSEASAIRLAFAFALESAGVSGAKMAAACKRLGLEADFSFSEKDAKVYTALSREEVRDIMEQSLGGRVGQGKGKPLISINDNRIIDKNNRIIDDDEIIIPKNRIHDEDKIIEKDDNKYIELIEKDDITDTNRIEIKGKGVELGPKDPKAIAKRNFDTLVEAYYSDFYDEPHYLTRAEVKTIIQHVYDWEKKLSFCKVMDGEVKSRFDLNEDLKNFIKDNGEALQEAFDEVIAKRKDRAED